MTGSEPAFHDRVDVDFLMVADWAEVVAGKLYLQGGGWDTLTIAQGFPCRRGLAIAVGFLIPWAQTNQKHRVGLAVLNEHTQTVALQVDAEMEAGRPPGSPSGGQQQSLMALNTSIEFAGPSSFLVTASVDGEECRRRAFRVVALPGPAAVRKQAPRT